MAAEKLSITENSECREKSQRDLIVKTLSHKEVEKLQDEVRSKYQKAFELLKDK